MVAEEIQKLAEQTKRAVDDIGNIVTESVHNTDNAVSVMEQSARLTETGMLSIQEVGEVKWHKIIRIAYTISRGM